MHHIKIYLFLIYVFLKQNSKLCKIALEDFFILCMCSLSNRFFFKPLNFDIFEDALPFFYFLHLSSSPNGTFQFFPSNES